MTPNRESRRPPLFKIKSLVQVSGAKNSIGIQQEYLDSAGLAKKENISETLLEDD